MEYPQEKVKPYGQEGKKVEQVERMFDHIAPAYDRLNRLMSLGIDRSWRRTALKWLRPHRPALVLDVATGTGDFAIQACRMLPSASLTGVDLSEGMMQVGRRKVEQAGLAARIDFQREDCEALTFSDASFDAVTVAFGIRNFEHLDRGLREMCRVLRPGGHLVILELSTPDRPPMKQLYRIYSRLIPLMGRLVSHDRSAYTYLPQSIRAFPQGEVMSESIRRAGFSDVRFRRLTFGVCTLYMATK
ncbi:MAG TPA: bifunctional demethylmenaquinone methyltransferase/2-methoxy-6-polyprenyl-1,4-benzoquinol methylase UbiE [Candidatus Bacteroides intestinavium]|uniref:Demethylmenaquinone methyltransferase n=1 Tax=Candidatus Bacteroides intestinavium TaxID=2838469 RepID=A0A9D2HTF1_9BACE|nr:bifunctional demethylmenaquinone methyltransferase/2-methoxy-6-polyprenyl-1,4-benzoquinol methylase UbiE [Candidatus Bacteroides intestinavium]